MKSQRILWSIKPVTKIKKSSKVYNRKKSKKNKQSDVIL